MTPRYALSYAKTERQSDKVLTAALFFRFWFNKTDFL